MVYCFNILINFDCNFSNVAEALVSKGLATVVRYRADDDQRSAHFDELLSAETKALKAGKGMHSKKDVPVHRVVDLSGVNTLFNKFFIDQIAIR